MGGGGGGPGQQVLQHVVGADPPDLQIVLAGAGSGAGRVGAHLRVNNIKEGIHDQCLLARADDGVGGRDAGRGGGAFVADRAQEVRWVALAVAAIQPHLQAGAADEELLRRGAEILRVAIGVVD